jgi:hypothetical protein
MTLSRYWSSVDMKHLPQKRVLTSSDCHWFPFKIFPTLLDVHREERLLSWVSEDLSHNWFLATALEGDLQYSTYDRFPLWALPVRSTLSQKWNRQCLLSTEGWEIQALGACQWYRLLVRDTGSWCVSVDNNLSEFDRPHYTDIDANCAWSINCN